MPALHFAYLLQVALFVHYLFIIYNLKKIANNYISLLEAYPLLHMVMDPVGGLFGDFLVMPVSWCYNLIPLKSHSLTSAPVKILVMSMCFYLSSVGMKAVMASCSECLIIQCLIIYVMQSTIWLFWLHRLVTTSFFKYSDFKAPSSKTFGHLEFPKEGRDYINEDYVSYNWSYLSSLRTDRVFILIWSINFVMYTTGYKQFLLHSIPAIVGRVRENAKPS